MKYEKPTIIQKTTPNSIKLILDSEEDKGEVEFYSIFDGITLAFIKIDTERWPGDTMPDNKSIAILNYCVKGRCEVNVEKELSTCISENELCLSSISKTRVEGYTFTSKYYGIEFFFDIELLAKASNLVTNNFQIDIIGMIDYYCFTKKDFISIVDAKIETAFEDLWTLRNDSQLFKMKIQVLEILFLLAEKTLPLKNKGRIFLTKTQVQIVKAVEKIITSNLQTNFTVLELANKFSIGESSLKNYFKALYGQSITVYLREVRMNEASKQLAETRKRVSDIAIELGYENQSKFAAVFKSFFEVSPLEYRKLKQLEMNDKELSIVTATTNGIAKDSTC